MYKHTLIPDTAMFINTLAIVEKLIGPIEMPIVYMPNFTVC
jgi:hypothetical protein